MERGRALDGERGIERNSGWREGGIEDGKRERHWMERGKTLDGEAPWAHWMEEEG